MSSNYLLNWMNATNSASLQKILIFLWLLIVTLFSMLILFWVWNENFFDFLFIKDKLMFKTFTYAFFGGVLGSVVYAFRGFYQSIAEPRNSKRSFNFKWVFWYLVRPLAGGIFGFVAYSFTRAELGAFGLTEKVTEQNNLMFFALSFLAGFGFHDFAEYLSKKIAYLFKGNKNNVT